MTEIVNATLLFRPESAGLRFLPEGPYPVGPSRFSWVAIQHGADADHGSLNVFDMASGENRGYQLPGRPGFAFPCDDGRRWITGCERRLGFFTPKSGEWQPCGEEIDADRSGTIINDAVIWENNLVFGTKDLEFANKKAGLYLYRGSDGAIVRLRDDQICSNGKAIRRNDHGLELVDIDSPTRTVVAYDLDIAAATLSPPRTVLDLTHDSAVPDGAILTPDGDSIIISFYNPDPAPYGETRQYSLADGRLQRVWRTEGSPQNTCPNLVSHQGRVWLVITTAVEHMPVDRQSDAPNAGCLFAAETEFESVGSAPSFPTGRPAG